MKLLRMKCVYDPELLPEECGGRLGQVEYFVKLETKAEWRVLENFTCYGADLSALNSMIRTTDDYVMGDHDVYYYIGVDEQEPTVAEQYTDADGLVWKRVE